MSREILFRAKRVDDGEWVEGSYFKILDSECFLKEKEVLKHHIVNEFGKFEVVDPSTVCQYTGLNDANGKRIFEGDIVKEKCHNILFTVEWSVESLCYFIKTIAGGKEYLCDIWDCNVIGNIFDNHELLEVEG